MVTNTEWETNLIRIAPIFSGSLSAISSSLILYIILRSETRLSSLYHRIMFGMSLADVLNSTSIALSLLPMPSYMPMEEELEYRWSGLRIGNTATCNAQGFFQTFGLMCTFHYNSMLCVYYACAIAFTMRETNIKKYVEPFLHGIPILYGLLPSLGFLFSNMYNPQIGNRLPYTSWCTISGYPMNCGQGNECIRGFNASTLLLVVGGITSSQAFIIIVGSLSLVLRKVIMTERVLIRNAASQRIQDIENILEKHSNTKVVLVQALLYIIAFLIGVFPPFVRIMLERSNQSDEYSQSLLLGITLLLLPLQGFFNLLIFISHKVYNYRRVNNTESICSIVKLLFFTSAHEPHFIARISFVRRQEDEFDPENEALFDVVTHDEGCCDLMEIRLHLMSKKLDVSCPTHGQPLEVHSTHDETSEDAFSVAYGFDQLSHSYPSKSPLSLVDDSFEDDSTSFAPRMITPSSKSNDNSSGLSIGPESAEVKSWESSVKGT